MKVLIILFLSFITPSINSHEFSSNVIELDNSSFQKMILDNPSIKQIYLIMFYSPGCGHCKRLIPAWNEVADELKSKNIDNLTLFAADVSKQRNIARVQKIQAYPTIRLFYKNRQYEYVGSRSPQDLKEFGLFKFLERQYQQLGPEPSKYSAIKTKLQYYWDSYLDFVESHFYLYLTVTVSIIVFGIVGIAIIMSAMINNEQKKKIDINQQEKIPENNEKEKTDLDKKNE